MRIGYVVPICSPAAAGRAVSPLVAIDAAAASATRCLISKETRGSSIAADIAGGPARAARPYRHGVRSGKQHNIGMHDHRAAAALVDRVAVVGFKKNVQALQNGIVNNLVKPRKVVLSLLLLAFRPARLRK